MSELPSKELFAFRDDPEAIRAIGQRCRSSGVVSIIEMHNSMESSAAEIERLQKRIRELEAASAHEPQAVELTTAALTAEIERLRLVIKGFVEGPPAQMGTPLGMLPINSQGMRQLVDALNGAAARRAAQAFAGDGQSCRSVG
jgi:hypothetical protein